MRCLQISKGQENILVPMPSIEYSSDKKLNGTFSEGQIILASRLIKNCIDWSIKNGKSYDFDTYFKKSAKANKSKLLKIFFVRSLLVYLFKKFLMSNQKWKKTILTYMLDLTEDTTLTLKIYSKALKTMKLVIYT